MKQNKNNNLISVFNSIYKKKLRIKNFKNIKMNIFINNKFKFKKKIYKIIFMIIKLIYIFIIIIIVKSYLLNFNNNKNTYNYIKNNNKRIQEKKILKIKFAIYIPTLFNGGRERITSLLLNYLSKEQNFDLYLFSKNNKNENEYKIPDVINRIVVLGFEDLKNKLINNNIDVFVYQFYNLREIEILNELTNFKTIFYNHSMFLFWIYFNKTDFLKNFYRTYKKSKFIISLIPFENDFLFKKWGINSILMNNFITYDYEQIIPSNLTSKIIIMIGRGSDPLKRFDLGIKAMKYIVEEIPDIEMKIISDLNGIEYLVNLTKELNLTNNIKFEGYTFKPEIYYSNASLHIFPTEIECFPMVLSETKVFGIPNILVGIDYVSQAEGGVININDDNPITISRESIKILKNETYRKQLGRDARKSMKKFSNKLTLKKWIDLIFAVNKGEYYYNELKKKDKEISKMKAINQLKNQLKFIKKRIPTMKNISLNDLYNLSFIDKLKM